MNKKIWLVIGIVLLFIGLGKPNLSFPLINLSPSTIETHITDFPSDPVLAEKAKAVTDIFRQNYSSTTKNDCLKLSALYADLATLIELDGKDLVVKDTAAIREANSLCGKMLRLNIKDKYPDLSAATQSVIVAGIGDDDVLLSPELRSKAAESFRALSWGCYEGSK